MKRIVPLMVGIFAVALLNASPLMAAEDTDTAQKAAAEPATPAAATVEKKKEVEVQKKKTQQGEAKADADAVPAQVPVVNNKEPGAANPAAQAIGPDAVGAALPTVKLAEHEQLVPPTPQKPTICACPEEETKAKVYKHRMTFMPLPMLVGIGSFKYQGVLSDRVTIDLMPVFYTLIYQTKYAGGGMELAFSIFPVTKAPGGFNFSFGLMPLYVKQDNTLVLVPKMTFGYNWIWKSGFTLGLAGGMMGVYQKSYAIQDSEVFRVLPYLDLNMGFVF